MSFHTRLSQLKWDVFSLMSFPLNVLPIEKNKIVFQNFSGRGYGDSPKYIAETILKNKSPYNLVWLCDDLNEDMPSQIRKVKYGSVAAYLEMATAGIWVNNVWTGLYSIKRKNQFFLQTWHGSISMKKIEKAVESNLSSEYIRTAKRMSKKCDLMISNARWLTEQFNRDFWYEGEILEKGLPRLDVLYNTSQTVFNKVYKYFGLKETSKVILYAPTFRKNESIENYILDYANLCRVMKEKFGNNYVMLLRLHPNASKYQSKLPITKEIHNATDYPDMQELLAVADTLITDYSSSMFEMGMIQKKIFLFAKDYNDYINNDRGETEFSLSELPFPMAFTESELVENVMNYDEEKNQEKMLTFFKSLGVIKAEDSAMEILKRIEEKRT